VDEAKTIRDKAEAIRAYARQVKNPKLEADCWEIRKRAEDKLGELSRALEKSVLAGKGKRNLPAGGKIKAVVLKDAGISTSAANRYEQFNKLSAREKEQRIARGRAAIEAGRSVADSIIRRSDKQERRAEREKELASNVTAMPGKNYGVLYADPPWRFEPYSRETGMDRAADNHYPTMDVEALMQLQVPAAKNCILFLWATVPMLPQALAVMEAWDFEYKSNFAWDKMKAGTGYWNRNRHELLLVGVRGKVPAPDESLRGSSVIAVVREQHSAKPIAFRKLIEKMFPTVRKVELFAREQSNGWDVWGNEVQEAAE
jgi:N6-adenosine-specific RNA methylase IME4